MNRTSGLLAAAALCVASGVMNPRAAHAYDVHGLGLGADVALGGPSGLAMTWGLGRMELDFILGATFVLPEGGVLEPDFGGAAGFFYTLTDATHTNFQLGGRVGVLIDAEQAAGLGGVELRTNAGITFEADMRLEHRLDDHCVLNFQVGIMTAIWPDDSTVGTPRADFTMGIGGTGLVGGAGFRYYFESLGAAAAPPPPPPPARRAVEPAPATAPATTEGSGETPYWE
jgi:hypothetical protein